MSFAEKQLLQDSILSGMSDQLTGTQLMALKHCIEERLDTFSVEQKTSYSSDTDDYLTAFLSAKKVEGRSEKTIERYEYIIGKMQNFISVPTRHITVYHLRDYFAVLKSRGISDRSLEGMRSVFSSYFGWLQRECLIDKNPCANIGVIKYKKKVLLPYSDVEIYKLRESCKTQRDLAIVHFLLSTGCRISEVCTLNRNSVNFHKKECVVLGKGNKERTVYIDNITSLVLQRYLRSRTDLSVALFAGKGTDRMKPGGIRKMLKQLEHSSCVDNVHPHRFRRTLATNLIARGMPIQEVACILGHDNINTTMTYVYIGKPSVHNSYDRCV